MSDTKLDPKTLTAVVRENYPPPPPMAGWLGFYYDSDSDNGGAGWYCSGKVHADREDALCELASFFPFEGSALVEVGQAGALFGASEPKVLPCGCVRCTCENENQCQGCGAKLCEAHRQKPAPPEPASEKVECPNCWQLVATNEEHVSSRNRDSFTCQPAASIDTTKTVAYCDELEARYGQPAPPEPAATEMPEAVKNAWKALRKENYETFALALESWWRTHAAQPVANVANVGMTEELEVVLRLAAQHVEGWQQTYQSPEYRKQMLSAIAAVRAQATAPKKLEKVRSFLNLMGLYYKKADTDLPQKAHTQGSAWAEALAELDAFEGKP